MKGDSRKSIEFLKKSYPQGPWCLAAIAVDQKGIETRTFWPDDPVPDVGYDTSEEGCFQWLEKHNGKANLYWHVNPVISLMQKKAERTDIKEVCFLQVDVDPENSTEVISLQDQQEAILSRFFEKRPRGVPEPTFVIFSGGGYQGFWKLAESIQIGGDIARAEDAKRYNQQLELLFKADNCHNIDRLMRLPYTVNLPSAKKRAKGRVAAVATIVEADWSRVYQLNQFTQATMVQVSKDLSVAGSQVVVEISGNVKRIDELDELDKWNVPARVKVIIMQGHHPDADEIEKKRIKLGKNPSRSEWLFDVVCNLVRCEVPDPVIYSIITDPKFGVAESVVELKSQAHRYAVKQITSAKEHVEDPALAELNERYCAISQVGGKMLIAYEDESEIMLGAKEWYFMRPEEFVKIYENQKVVVGSDKDGKPIQRKMGVWWREHPKRRQVSKLVFRPNVADVPDAINLWRGFTVPALAGDKHLGYKDHLLQNICKGSVEHFEYLWRWMARVVQYPAEAGQVAVVLLGLRGTGKGFFVNTFGKLFGRHYIHASNASHIVGNFNGHLRACCLLFADEAMFVGDRKTQGVLKALITEPTFMIERKGIDAEICPNYLHVIMASNDEHVIRAGMEERRFFVLNVSDEAMQNTAYFNTIAKDMEDGGLGHLLYDLLQTDLKDFNVRDVPKTAALAEQADLSLSPIEAWWLRSIRDGAVGQSEGWRTIIPKDELLDDFVRFSTRASRGVYSELNEVSFGIYLKKLVGQLDSKRLMMERERFDDERGLAYTKKERVPCYIIPGLAECRAYWDRKKRKETWNELPLE